MLTLENIVWNAPTGQGILKGINITIPDGKFVVITGPNGGGKTTIAKLIAGIEEPDSGKIFLDGEDLSHLDITQRAKRGISYAFQQPVRFKGLTVKDLIETASAKAMSDEQLCELLSKVGLCAKEYIKREVNASLSGGEIKRIEIATILARKSKCIIFDEPEAGIDLWSFTNLISVFQNMRQTLVGCLIVISHQERILSIADEIIVVKDGLVQASGPRDKILPSLIPETPSCIKCPNGKDDN